jgi:L-threonylcarbamoyladenylate synthase
MTSLAQYLLQPGAIAVIPTDTVYGLVARAADETAVKRLYTTKNRQGKPGTLIAANIDQLVDLGFKRRYLTAVEQFWPGAVSVIIPCPELEYLHQGLGSLAVRIPDDPWLQKVLLEVGPLQTSSANAPGDPPATTVEEAREYFGDAVAWYEDGGVVNREPSTVIQVIDDAIEIVRQGAVKLDESGRRVE